MNFNFAKFFSLYKEWSDRNIEDWLEKRRKGSISFIVHFGVVKWGGFMFSIFFLKRIFFGQGVGFEDILFDFFIWSIAGFIFGLGVWLGTESFFRNMKKISRQSSD